MKPDRELYDTESQDEQFRTLFTRYSSYVYTIVWNRIRHVGTHEDAEEAVSDVFAEVFRNYEHIESSKMEGYIRTLSVRKGIDMYRRLSARKEVPTEDEAPWQTMPSGENIEQEHDAAALRKRLLACIRELGEPDASIVIAKFYYDCNAREIGERVGLSPIAVRTRLSRAIRKLRKRLDGEDITFE
ncbi:MAG: sigma-70 family RNA polymerase sigma factor [Oscillospiraceae bacterium]|nr:sigma-70 family RNA polymerase sigma factor [Oscillospiraceae bacterium]